MTKQEKIKEGIRNLIDGCYNARNPEQINCLSAHEIP